MTRTFWQALFGGTFFVAPLLMAQPATVETLFHRAENQVPVAIVEIKRPPEHTEIHLQAQAALTKVCVAASGPDSPYLLARAQLPLCRWGEYHGLSRTPRLCRQRNNDLAFRASCGGFEHVLVRVGSGWGKAADRRRLPNDAVLEFSTCEVELKGGLDLTSLAD